MTAWEYLGTVTKAIEAPEKMSDRLMEVQHGTT